MTTFHVPHSAVEISAATPSQQAPTHIRFLEPSAELERALTAMLEFKDQSTPVDRRRALRDTARAFALEVQGPGDATSSYFVHPPNGLAAPLMRDLQTVSFELFAA